MKPRDYARLAKHGDWSAADYLARLVAYKVFRKYVSDPPKAKMPRSPRAEWRLDMARMAVQDVLRVEPEKCRGCNGTMVFYGRRGQEKRCPTCDGTGKHYYTRQDYVETMRTDEVTWKRWEWLYREMVTILKKMT